MTFHIKKSESPVEGIRRIAREQISIVLQDFLDEQLTDKDRVHSLRARCKKMRALLRLPGPLMCERFQVEDQRFRAAPANDSQRFVTHRCRHAPSRHWMKPRTIRKRL